MDRLKNEKAYIFQKHQSRPCRSIGNHLHKWNRAESQRLSDPGAGWNVFFAVKNHFDIKYSRLHRACVSCPFRWIRSRHIRFSLQRYSGPTASSSFHRAFQKSLLYRRQPVNRKCFSQWSMKSMRRKSRWRNASRTAFIRCALQTASTAFQVSALDKGAEPLRGIRVASDSRCSNVSNQVECSRLNRRAVNGIIVLLYQKGKS